MASQIGIASSISFGFIQGDVTSIFMVVEHM